MSTLDPMTALPQLLFRLYAALDDHEFETLHEIFTPDAEGTTPGGTAVGRDRLVAQARRSHENIPRLQHHVSNVLVESATDTTATLRAVVESIFVTQDGIPAYRIGETYRASAVLSDGDWRLAAFSMVPVWQVGIRPVEGRLVAAA